MTDSSVERAEVLIVEYPNITLRFFALEPSVSYGSAHAIVNEQLGRSKGCARRAPHQLTTKQEEQRVTICRNWFQGFKPNDRKRFSDIVTGDECWISFFTIKDKFLTWCGRPKVNHTRRF